MVEVGARVTISYDRNEGRIEIKVGVRIRVGGSE